MSEERVIYKMNSSERVDQAILFATERHAGQTRKGGDIPYILHPLEVMTILQSMQADKDLLIAGVLHDTVEDTDTTLDEIDERFGADVAMLVGGHTEDKSKTWRQRKEEDLWAAAKGSKRLKMLVMADKVANLRSLYHDRRMVGPAIWERFNASREQQCWYYNRMVDAMYEMQYEKETSVVYWEMVTLFKELFVTFAWDQKKDMLYQISADGEGYVLKLGNGKWNPFIGELAEDVVILSRREAELLEDSRSI